MLATAHAATPALDPCHAGDSPASALWSEHRELPPTPVYLDLPLGGVGFPRLKLQRILRATGMLHSLAGVAHPLPRVPRTLLALPQGSLADPKASLTVPQASLAGPRASFAVRQAIFAVPHGIVALGGIFLAGVRIFDGGADDRIRGP